MDKFRCTVTWRRPASTAGVVRCTQQEIAAYKLAQLPARSDVAAPESLWILGLVRDSIMSRALIMARSG